MSNTKKPEVRPERMAHLGRTLTTRVPPNKTVDVIVSVFVERGFQVRERGTDTAELTFGSGWKQWAATMLPTELLPATRDWGHDLTVHLTTTEQTWEGCTVRVDSSGSTAGHRAFDLFSETLDAAVIHIRSFGPVEAGEIADRS